MTKILLSKQSYGIVASLINIIRAPDNQMHFTCEPQGGAARTAMCVESRIHCLRG